MEKLKMHSPDLVAGNIEKIAALFPNCITEAKDADGNITRAVDFDLLKQELSSSAVEGPQERYRLDWPGKREALLAANAPIAKTLRPCREDSVNFDTTKNLFVEGDNLDALKLLQETYLGKVKMIYIDPPYNTGKDLLYADDFRESTDTYFARSFQEDEVGHRMVANNEANGRFHSDWLSMIYPRLKLARNLLRDDGLIFISIDDNEQDNLRKICDAIFGEENLVNVLVWKKRYNAAKEQHLAVIHDYVLIYAKNKGQIPDFFVIGDKEYFETYFTEVDEHVNSRGKFMTQPLEAGNSMDARPNLRFPILAPDNTEIWPRRQWVWNKERVAEAQEKGALKFYRGQDAAWKVRHKQYEKDESGAPRKVKPFTIFDKCLTQDGTKEIEQLFGSSDVFAFPKPTRLVQHFLQLANDPSGIYLDFFAGSGTTADAIFKLNATDGGRRRFILVQLPESIDTRGFSTIAEITKERIRRAGTKSKSENATTSPSLDFGFRVLKINTSNMKEVYYAPDAVKQFDLVAHADNIKEDRTPEDLLFQVLVDWGVDLALPITKEIIAGKTVFFVDGNALAACFDTEISEELVTALAKRRLHDLPLLKVVFRDAGYASDSAKINVEQIFKLLSPTTEFRTL
jgi:adenine-specific DNA-methyltransferase